jgi:hypothetical protein
MKTVRFALLFCFINLLSKAPMSRAAELLTFDDLPTIGGNLAVPNGYGGLQWLGFGVIPGAGSAYGAGMVSTPNVAFNYDEFDRTADISSSNPFSLNSAYLTGYLNTFQIEVQGFMGNTKVSDNTYTVGPNAPTLVNFNNASVTLVAFLPENLGSSSVNNALIFVMDNLSVNVPEPSVWALFLASAALMITRQNIWKQVPATSPKNGTTSSERL